MGITVLEKIREPENDSKTEGFKLIWFRLLFRERFNWYCEQALILCERAIDIISVPEQIDVEKRCYGSKSCFGVISLSLIEYHKSFREKQYVEELKTINPYFVDQEDWISSIEDAHRKYHKLFEERILRVSKEYITLEKIKEYRTMYVRRKWMDTYAIESLFTYLRKICNEDLVQKVMKLKWEAERECEGYYEYLEVIFARYKLGPRYQDLFEKRIIKVASEIIKSEMIEEENRGRANFRKWMNGDKINHFLAFVKSVGTNELIKEITKIKCEAERYLEQSYQDRMFDSYMYAIAKKKQQFQNRWFYGLDFGYSEYEDFKRLGMSPGNIERIKKEVEENESTLFSYNKGGIKINLHIRRHKIVQLFLFIGIFLFGMFLMY